MVTDLFFKVMASAILISGPFAAPDIIDDGLGRRLDAAVSRMAEYGYSGAVLVEVGDRVVLSRGYGLADRSTGRLNAPDTPFDVASIAKTVAGAAVLRLQAEGKLTVFDRLDEHLGSFPDEKTEASIHHLATHTAGLAVRGTDVSSAKRAEFIQLMKETPRESAPGDEYRYTNAGISLMAAIVEVASGRPYEQYAREHLFRRAGLKEVSFRWEPGIRPGIAVGYDGPPGESRPAESRSGNWGDRAAGGLVATVTELRDWYRALRAGRVLPDLETRLMFHPWPREGYGWHVERSSRRDLPVIHKGGDVPGATSQILAYPTEKIIIVWTSNDTSQRWRTQLNEALSRICLDEPYSLLPPVGIFSVPTDVPGTLFTETGVAVNLVPTGAGLRADLTGLDRGILLFRAVGRNHLAAPHARSHSALHLRLDNFGEGRLVDGDLEWSLHATGLQPDM